MAGPGTVPGVEGDDETAQARVDDATAGEVAPGRVVETSYVSSEPVIRREAAAVVREVEGAPGYWRPFVLKRLGLLALIAVLVVVLLGWGKVTLAGTVRGAGLLLVTSAALTWFDVVLTRRRVRRSAIGYVARQCPPGTPVRARWSRERVVFVAPTHEVRLDLATVTAARHRPGVLLLDQQAAALPWVVPEELLGEEALAVVRASLGSRYRRVP